MARYPELFARTRSDSPVGWNEISVRNVLQSSRSSSLRRSINEVLARPDTRQRTETTLKADDRVTASRLRRRHATSEKVVASADLPPCASMIERHIENSIPGRPAWLYKAFQAVGRGSVSAQGTRNALLQEICITRPDRNIERKGSY
jgi:hypothetical protein